jgi:hypothetical protein
MSIRRQLTVFAILAITAIAPTPVQATRIDDVQDRWARQQEKLAATQSLWQDADLVLFTSLPTNLRAIDAAKVHSEPIAYWGWYGPAYRYGYGGPPPYRYYRGYATPYNTYYGGYPDYYYGPRVGVRVYPSGRVWGGYW